MKITDLPKIIEHNASLTETANPETQIQEIEIITQEEGNFFHTNHPDLVRMSASGLVAAVWAKG